MASLPDLKRVACETIDHLATDLHDVSKAIWNKPELGFEEHGAHDVLCDFLDKEGFPVERKYKLETAFRAVYGGEGPHVAVLAEYDALPDIGHACGHNLIAEVGVGAGAGIKAALQETEKYGQKLGKVTVLGTPAEEKGGGKIRLIDNDAFKGVDFSMMCHPFCLDVTRWSTLANSVLTVTYKGKASHGAMGPWNGLNALDAAVMAYNNVSCLRQQMKPKWRVNGIITNGGAQANIIPELTALEYHIRAPTLGEQEALKAKMVNCFEAAASATGCEVDLEWRTGTYQNLITNEQLATLYDANMEQLGVKLHHDEKVLSETCVSTDMGNVSQLVPSIHPLFYIGTDAMNHTRPYTTATGNDAAQPYTLTQAKVLAMTALDVLYQPELLLKMKADFAEDLKNDAVIV